jgi:N-acetylneuraminic acid mutarotase
VAQIVKALAGEKVSVAAQPIIDLDKAAPYTVGFYTGGADMTYAAVLDVLCACVGAWWGFDNHGIFWCRQLTIPVAAEAIMTLTPTENVQIDRIATADSDKGVPVWRVSVDYSKNWTVQTSGLAGSVAGNELTFTPDDPAQLTTDRKNMLAMEYIRTKAENSTIQTLHKLAPELVITTTLNAQADANTEAARILAMRSVRRDRLNVQLPISALQYPGGGYWDNEAISQLSFGRYGHAAVVCGNWLYVIGGRTIGNANTAAVMRLDLMNPTSAWDDLGVTDLPAPRAFHTAAFFGTFLYVIGGVLANSIPTASVIRLDLTNPTGAWDDAGISDLPAARSTHATVLYGTWLCVIGGADATGHPVGTILGIELSHPTWLWSSTSVMGSAVPDLPAPRASHAAVMFNNYLYIVGGNAPGLSASVIRLDLDNPAAVWDDIGVTNLPSARAYHSAVVFGNWLYVLGGQYASFLASVMRIDLNNPTGAWDDAGATDLPAGRGYMATVIYAPDNAIYSIGGYTPTPQFNTWRLRLNNNPADVAHLTSLGRTVLVKQPRYGYDAGRPMKIIGTTSDYANRSMTLELWG